MAMQPTFRFIGVTTGQSSALKMWPAWMAILGRPEVVIQGVDLPLHAPPEEYRRVVDEIKRAPNLLGALVTTHKIDLLAATRDRFDELGHFAALCAEVSSISKDGDRLVGHATDPSAGGRSLQALLRDGYFGRTGGHVLCLGTGGAGTALSLYLATTPAAADRPERIVLVDVNEVRLTKAQHLLDGLETDVHFEYLLSDDPTVNDRRMAALPDASLVINATGMGKDRPGSPVTAAGLFPRHGIAWDLNYRGQLDFLQHARAQQAARTLTVADGWTYFIHGWSSVVEHVLHLTIDAATLAELSRAAAAVRT
jgi:shikimate dehydrogenase